MWTHPYDHGERHLFEGGLFQNRGIAGSKKLRGRFVGMKHQHSLAGWCWDRFVYHVSNHFLSMTHVFWEWNQTMNQVDWPAVLLSILPCMIRRKDIARAPTPIQSELFGGFVPPRYTCVFPDERQAQAQGRNNGEYCNKSATREVLSKSFACDQLSFGNKQLLQLTNRH